MKNPYEIYCLECKGFFNYLEHVVADFDETIVSTCPYCGEEVEVAQ